MNLRRTRMWLSRVGVALLPAFSDALGAISEPGSAVYINKYYEERDGVGTKFVFGNGARVAAVTDALSERDRLQRLRLVAGWNLLSLTVSLSNALSQLKPPGTPQIETVYAWQPEFGSNAPVPASVSLPSGAVLWIKAATNCQLPVSGRYQPLGQITLQSGGNFVPAIALQAWPASQWPTGLSVQYYYPLKKEWSLQATAPLEVGSIEPSALAPGAVLFVRSSQSLVLPAVNTGLSLRFYHQDHLNSTAALTDRGGRLVETASYFPFGAFRGNPHPAQAGQPYSFTGKERDHETGLGYFEARFLPTALGRFLSPDPLEDSGNRSTPQDWNPYAYGRNNPIRYNDPQGTYVWDQSLGGSSADDKVSKEVRDQRQVFRDALTTARNAVGKMAAGADKDLVMRSLDAYGAEGADNAVDVGLQTKAGGHVKYSAKTGRQAATFSLSAGTAQMVGTVAHEGTHVADNRDFWAAAKKDRQAAKTGPLNITDYEQEVRGFKVESILGQAMGRKTVQKADYVIFDRKWAEADIAKNRAAGIDQLLENHPTYKLTPASPGTRILQ